MKKVLLFLAIITPFILISQQWQWTRFIATQGQISNTEMTSDNTGNFYLKGNIDAYRAIRRDRVE